MSINDIIGAIVGLVLPAALKQFWPAAEPRDSLPAFTWCVAGFVGGALGGLASAIFGFLAATGGIVGPAAGLAATGIGNWALFGAAIGLMQWFALRGYREVGTWFILSSVIGWMFFIFGGSLAGWIVAGAAIGVMQSLSLARWNGALWWIVGNVVAWPVAGGIGYNVGLVLLAYNPVLAWIVGWGVVGLVGAVILLVPLLMMAGRKRQQTA